MQKITPFLWFDGKAMDAVSFYVSVFKNSRIISKTPGPDGKVMSVVFELNGQQFYAINGGPKFKFNEAASFFIACESQEEIDYFWEKLSEGGQESRCGWVKDKFGLWWQVVPFMLNKMLAGKDPAKSARVMNVMLKMDKFDMGLLQKAFDGN